MKPSILPEWPWQKLGTDLFGLKDQTYLLVDYFSRYVEIAKLTQSTCTSAAVIEHLKSIFARYSIPEIVCSDNGLQYSAFNFVGFAEEYWVTHITSSLNYPQSNGEAERKTG